MDAAVAIAIISNSELDQKGDIVAAIEQLRAEAAQVEGLTSEKNKLAENNASLLAQKSTANKRVKELEEKIADLTKAIAADGEDQDAALERFKGLADELKQAKEELTAAQQKEQDAIAAKASLEQQLVYRDAGAKLNVAPIVFEKLLGLPGDRLAVEGDKVLVKGEGDDAKPQAFSDYLEAQPDDIKKLVAAAMGEVTDGGNPPPKPKPGPTAPPTEGGKKDDARSTLASMGFKGPAIAKS